MSSLPGSSALLKIGLPDYVLHAGGYAILCLLLYVALRQGWGVGVRNSTILSWIISVIYGLTDEYHQSFVPRRTPDLRDLLADAVGALLILCLIHVIRRLKGRSVGRTV